MSDLDSIVSRCLSLDKSDRELDADIARMSGWIHKCDTIRWGVSAPHWWKDDKSQGEIIGGYACLYETGLPFFTESIDAARSVFDLTNICHHWSVIKLENGLIKAFLSTEDFKYGVDAILEAPAICALLLIYRNYNLQKRAERAAEVAQALSSGFLPIATDKGETGL